MVKRPLEGRTALVTGGSRGIGRAIALALGEAGADVALSYLSASTAALDVVDELGASDSRAIAVQADLSRAADIRRLIETVLRKLGPIDVLVNNAGINPSKPLADLEESDWDHAIAVNLTSAFLTTQAVLPTMRERQWGRIIMLSSIAAQTGGVIGPHYAASKAGLIGLTHSYANLLAKEGITANAIAPALIETDMIKGNARLTPTLLPVGRFGQTAEIASAAVLLATNGYITGQTLSVNGGWHMT